MHIMIFKKLDPIVIKWGEELIEPFLDTIRCHALLWSLGIRHGDISDTNLMINPANGTGVLNDFDLASVVDPLRIVKTGFERTGTMPFMALDLLRGVGFEGKFPRHYRHDLESFCWVFIWICYSYDQGKKIPQPSPCTRWITTSPDSCWDVKSGSPKRLRNSQPTDSYRVFQNILHVLAKFWVDFDYGCDEASFVEPDNVQILRNTLGKLPKCIAVDMQSWVTSTSHTM